MKRVLLVDDQPQPASHHRFVFGNLADVCRDVDELNDKIKGGDDWSAAFIDFDLSGVDDQARATGLSALQLLHQDRPDTRRIVYTTLSENGRTLFAVAAHRWLGATVVLDKSAGDEPTLRRAADLSCRNPTAAGWQTKMRSARLIDDLFADYNWLDLWRVWWSVHGSVDAAQGQLGVGHTPTSVERFSNLATQACLTFQAHFLGQEPEPPKGRYINRATPLASFAHRHATFFNAIDLPAILQTAEPWKNRPATAQDRPTKRRR